MLLARAQLGLPATVRIVGITAEFYGSVLLATSAYSSWCNSAAQGRSFRASVIEMATGCRNFSVPVSFKPGFVVEL